MSWRTGPKITVWVAPKREGEVIQGEAGEATVSPLREFGVKVGVRAGFSQELSDR